VLLRSIGLICGGHRAIVLENLALRQQLAVLTRTVKRPALRSMDRLFWILLAKGWLSFANIAYRQKSGKNTLGVGAAAGHSTGHARGVPDGRGAPGALSTRRDLLPEILALRHQLNILGRAGRRFRPSDRLAHRRPSAEALQSPDARLRLGNHHNAFSPSQLTAKQYKRPAPPVATRFGWLQPRLGCDEFHELLLPPCLSEWPSCTDPLPSALLV
jgi:hypothetical protein